MFKFLMLCGLIFDALGSANTQQASERSQILQKEGTLGYIKSTDMFGGDEYRRQKMREYAPDQAKKNAATFSPIKEDIFKVFEAELRHGQKTVDEVFGELRNSSGGVSSFAESIARANPAIEEELLLLEQRKGITDEEKIQ